MKSRELKPVGHPSGGILALFAHKDLPWSSRFRIGRHVAQCSFCDAQIQAVRSACLELRREAQSETLTSFEAIADWSRLEHEMVGNIVVGVSAGRCIEPVQKRRNILVPSACAAALLVVFALGWTTHVPSEQSQHVVNSVRSWWGGEALQQYSGTILRSSPGGIAVRSQGTTLTLLHPSSAMVSVSGGSAVEARYIDENTGQVTITSVYGQ